MSQKRRENVVRHFTKASNKPCIMLASLKAAGVGLNLVAANHGALSTLLLPLIVADVVLQWCSWTAGGTVSVPRHCYRGLALTRTRRRD